MALLEVHGAQLRAVRVAGGVRQVELARAAGCSVSHLWRAEHENRPISLTLAYRIARVLTELTGREVTIDQFTSATPGQVAA